MADEGVPRRGRKTAANPPAAEPMALIQTIQSKRSTSGHYGRAGRSIRGLFANGRQCGEHLSVSKAMTRTSRLFLVFAAACAAPACSKAGASPETPDRAAPASSVPPLLDAARCLEHVKKVC